MDNKHLKLMRHYPLCLFLFFTLSIGVLRAQDPTDQTGTGFQDTNFINDSLALVKIYQSFGGTASGLNWLQGPLDSWGDTDDEIVVSEGPEFGLRRVTAVDISGKELPGTLPEGFKELTALQTLNIADNRLSGLVRLDSLFALQQLDCSNNWLLFQDLTVLSGLNASVVYLPQQPLPVFDYYAIAGDDIGLRGYPERDTLPSNVYVWQRTDGSVAGDTRELFLEEVSGVDSTTFILTVTNPDFPGLAILAPIDLHVFADEQSLPFDPTSLIMRRGSAELPPEIDSTQIRYCDCTGAAFLPVLVEGIESLIDLNNIKRGQGSRIRKDTFDLNFFLDLEPVAEAESCGLTHAAPSDEDTARPYAATVAVVGSGIAPHRDLSPNFYTVEEAGSSPFDCITGGFIRWDFLNSTQRVTARNNHETHVAGIIAQNIPPDIELKLIDLKILDDRGKLFDLICALHFAAKAEVDVINLSLGYPYPEPSVPLHQALHSATEADVLVVVSSGNEGEDNDALPRWPGNFINRQATESGPLPALRNMLVVAALNPEEDRLADFSNFGTNTVHLAAQGSNVISTVMTESGSSGYTAFSGTSMSAAQASRALAILRAYAPGVPAERLRAVVQATTEPVAAVDPLVISTGKLNLEAAVRLLGLPNEAAILERLAAQQPPALSSNPPPTIVHEPHPSIGDIMIPLGDGSMLYENIHFIVKRIATNGEDPVVYEQRCAFGNAVYWDGLQADGNQIEPDEYQYLIEIRVGGRVVNIMPPMLRFATE